MIAEEVTVTGAMGVGVEGGTTGGMAGGVVVGGTAAAVLPLATVPGPLHGAVGELLLLDCARAVWHAGSRRLCRCLPCMGVAWGLMRRGWSCSLQWHILGHGLS